MLVKRMFFDRLRSHAIWYNFKRRCKNMKKISVIVAVVVMGVMVGCRTTAEIPSEGSVPTVETKAKPEIEYFPLVPEVKWNELNWLQKTTASIAIVPGCILSACANAYLWCAN